MLLVFQFQHLQKQQSHSRVIKYVHELVLITANNMLCTPQIFEKSAHVCTINSLLWHVLYNYTGQYRSKNK